MSQNVVTTRSASKESSSNPPASSDAAKTTSNTHKTPAAEKQSTPSILHQNWIMISWKI
jgi:hypothetical protein